MNKRAIQTTADALVALLEAYNDSDEFPQTAFLPPIGDPEEYARREKAVMMMLQDLGRRWLELDGTWPREEFQIAARNRLTEALRAQLSAPGETCWRTWDIHPHYDPDSGKAIWVWTLGAWTGLDQVGVAASHDAAVTKVYHLLTTKPDQPGEWADDEDPLKLIGTPWAQEDPSGNLTGVLLVAPTDRCRWVGHLTTAQFDALLNQGRKPTEIDDLLTQ